MSLFPGIYPDKDAFSSLLYMDFLACNLSNTATTGGHPHFDTRLFKKDEKEKSICVADSGDRKQTTEADEMAPLSGAYGFPFAHGKPYQFIVTDSDADLGKLKHIQHIEISCPRMRTFA